MNTEKKYTIVQINVTANTGSTGRIAEEISVLAMKEGWNTIIAYGRKNDHSLFSTIKVGNKVVLLYHVFKSRLLDMHGLASKKATKRLIRKIMSLNPSLIHLHNIHGYYLHYPLLFEFLHQSGTPVVWTLHDCWPFTGHCAYFDFVDCNKWKTECNQCPQKKEYPASLLADRSQKNYLLKKKLFNLPSNLMLVPVSGWLNGLLDESFLSGKPRFLIRNGINLNLFSRRESNFKERYQIGDKTLILGVASVWERRKGLEDFIRLSEMTDKDTAIVLVGLSKKQLRKIPPSIIGIKRTENINQLAEIYSSADVFFNPTREDNYPTTNMEAIACGTPVITYNTGGSIESVTEATGYVIEKGDLKACIEAINDIRNKDRNQIAELCIKHAIVHFNQEMVSQEYINLYEKILAIKQ